MPITQDRMLALLEAAKDYQQAWKRAQAYMEGLAKTVQDGHTPLPEAWAQVTMLLSTPLQLEYPIQTTETIASETTHFKLMYNRNANSAEWQRAKREGREPRRQRKKQNRKLVFKSERAEIPTQSWAEMAEARSVQIDADSDLGFGEEADSTPRQYPVRPGYDLPESICLHQLVVGGGCLKCGKAIAGAGESHRSGEG